MTVVLYSVIAASALVFAAASAWRAVWYARHPMHLRWELYPVPHETPARAAHGGSYFEAGEWWHERQKANRIGEWAFMAREIVFLHALREHNRCLWYRSFPFHFGLYLLIGAILAVLVEAAMLIATGAALPGATGTVLSALRTWTGAAGLALTLGGAIALFVYRHTSPDLRTSTTPGDLFNLLFFAAALGLVAAGMITAPAGSPGLAAIASGVLTWDLTLQVPGLLAAGLVTAALLAAYIPLTHMSHFIGKYFTYHAVRWDDRPMAGNRRIAAALAESLTYRSRWSAGHVAGGKTATWADVVAADPTKDGRR